jgi:hypothetical protein
MAAVLEGVNSVLVCVFFFVGKKLNAKDIHKKFFFYLWWKVFVA